MPKPPKPGAGSVCPQCSGTGQIWFADAIKGGNVCAPCGHAVCQGHLEDRITARVERMLQTWLAGRESQNVYELALADPQFTHRLIAGVMRHLPPDINARAKR